MQRLQPLTAIAVLALAIAACESANLAARLEDPHYTRLALVNRDERFHLTATQRHMVRRGFNADALERLLARIPPEHRDSVYQAFAVPRGNQVRELWYIDDPALQALLEQVWAPVWDGLSIDQIKADRSGRPGRNLAIQRRNAGK